MKKSLRPTPAPLVGRDLSGRLRLFTYEQSDEMTPPKFAGAEESTAAAYDGLSASQRGPPTASPRFGPGPEQWAVGAGEQFQTARPSSSRPVTVG